MNKIHLHGRLGRDPELKTMQGAKGDFQVCNFSVACRRSYGDETDWFNCIAMNGRAEVIAKFFEKGSEIILWGEMQSRKHDDKTYWSVKVEGFEFCGSKQNSGNDKAAATSMNEMPEYDEDDIPF